MLGQSIHMAGRDRSKHEKAKIVDFLFFSRLHSSSKSHQDEKQDQRGGQEIYFTHDHTPCSITRSIRLIHPSADVVEVGTHRV